MPTNLFNNGHSILKNSIQQQYEKCKIQYEIYMFNEEKLKTSNALF